MPKKNPTARAERQGSDCKCFPATCTLNNAITPFLVQEFPLDVVALLARRSGVHPVSVRQQLDAFGIGGGR